VTRPVVALHFNLIQDVSVLRPVARLAATLDVDILFLVSPHFVGLKDNAVWREEIDRLAHAVGAATHVYETLFDVVTRLTGRAGLCIAGSESNVPQHRGSHDLLRVLPSTFRTATLQHGYECVGFLHNARHSAVMGRDIRFAADILVGWFREDRLRDVAAAERAKLFIAGPTILIERPETPTPFDPDRGIICENTHSVRFASGDSKADFLDQASALAQRMHGVGRTLDFRPHPAARFLQRSDFVMPPGMEACDQPLYTLTLSRYAFAISAPSTVLFDFILADVPVALWGARALDVGNYRGLLGVDTADECWNFAAASSAMRDALLANQRRFLGSLGIPDDVRDRYLSLLAIAGA
jgi:hypothetical protein